MEFIPYVSDDLAPEQKLWRYMDLAKFVALLTQRAIYFASLSELAKVDPFEGEITRAETEMSTAVTASRYLKEFLERNPGADSATKVLTAERARTDARVNLRRSANSMVVSCWHANDIESEAMWRIYGAAGIAIETTVGQLRDALRWTSPISIGRVRYIDFDMPMEPPDRLPRWGYYKRRSYEHENEVRMVGVEMGGTGISINCDLRAVINRVHVAPAASTLFQRVVHSLCDGTVHGLHLDLVVSKLFEPPSF